MQLGKSHPLYGRKCETPPRLPAGLERRSASSSAPGRSILLRTRSCGFSVSFGLKLASSFWMIVISGQRVFRVEGRHIDEMDQNPGSLYVSQELNPQSRTFMGTVDQPGDIGNHKGIGPIRVYHPQLGRQRRKGIIADFWMGRRNFADEGRLAGIGKSDDSHVRQIASVQA